MSQISDRLRQFMVDGNYSVSSFSEALGMGQPSVSSYLNGSRTPGNKMQRRLRELGCDVEWLMTGAQKNTTEPNPTIQFDMPGHLTKEQGEMYKKLIEEIKLVSSDDPEAIEKMLILTQQIFKKKK